MTLTVEIFTLAFKMRAHEPSSDCDVLHTFFREVLAGVFAAGHGRAQEGF